MTEAEWATVAPMMSMYGTLTADFHETVDGCLCLEKAGRPWRFLPEAFGPRQPVRSWHDRFRADRVWADVAALLTRAERARRGRDPGPATPVMDSQGAASGPQGGERGVDGNKEVRGVKRHVLTCSLGDRCCLALALRIGAVAVTADKAWSRLDPALGIAGELVR